MTLKDDWVAQDTPGKTEADWTFTPAAANAVATQVNSNTSAIAGKADTSYVDTAVETAARAVIVSTGSEARPDGDVVFWVGGDAEPSNIGADDVWIPETVTDNHGIPFEPSYYHRLSLFGASDSDYSLANDEVAGVILVAGRTTLLTSLGIKIVTGGAAGSLIRFGVWELEGVTATLVADFGTVDGTVTGVAIKTGSAAIVAGRRYFVAVASQGTPATPPYVLQAATDVYRGMDVPAVDAAVLYTNALYPILAGGASGAFGSGTLGYGGTVCPALIGLCAT